MAAPREDDAMLASGRSTDRRPKARPSHGAGGSGGGQDGTHKLRPRACGPCRSGTYGPLHATRWTEVG